MSQPPPTPSHRYLEQCEAIRDGEHATLPPLTAAQLESKAERFTGVFTSQKDHGRRRRGRHGDGTDGGESQSHAAPTVGANASLATRMMLCRTATPSESDDEEVDDSDDGFALEASAEELPLANNSSSDITTTTTTTTASSKFLANATLVSSLSSATSRTGGAKGLTARIAAAQNQNASSKINTVATTNTSNNDNNNTSGPRDNPHAGAAAAAANNSNKELTPTPTPPPFQGRSLMSAEWISKHGAGAVGRRGQPRYATKGLTPGSWTATEDPISDGGMGATAGQGVGGSGGSGGIGGSVGLGSGTGNFSSQQGGGGTGASNEKRRERVTKRGLGRGWEGLYQVRSFEDTPDEE